jgi:hypothetical protein
MQFITHETFGKADPANRPDPEREFEAAMDALCRAFGGEADAGPALPATKTTLTFIWPRLTCPALACHHAAPWSRKISATSSSGRDMAAGCYAGGWSFSPGSGFLPGFLRGSDSRSSGLLTGRPLLSLDYCSCAILTTFMCPTYRRMCRAIVGYLISIRAAN